MKGASPSNGNSHHLALDGVSHAHAGIETLREVVDRTCLDEEIAKAVGMPLYEDRD
jgi:hypothetical protein